MVLWSVEQVLMFSDYLRYKTKYEVEIQFVNICNSFNHYIGIEYYNALMIIDLWCRCFVFRR